VDKIDTIAKKHCATAHNTKCREVLLKEVMLKTHQSHA